MGASALPAVLNSSTVPALVAELDASFYPTPTGGLAVRIGILCAIGVLFFLLAVLHLGMHVYNSSERPRYRSLWLVRLVERPSGKFIVLNSRPSWALAIFFCFAWDMFYLAAFYRAYALRKPQYAWIVARIWNGMFLFISGWIFSFSGLQAFLVAAESNDSRSIPAWVANAVFVGAGLSQVLLHLGLGAVNIVYDVRVFDRYVELRTALVALQASLGNRTPTLLDFIPIQPFSQALTDAGNKARPPGVVILALTSLLAVSCAVVNLGGLALARRLHLQIRQSVEVLALVNTRHLTTAGAGDMLGTNAAVPFAVDLSRAQQDSVVSTSPRFVGLDDLHEKEHCGCRGSDKRPGGAALDRRKSSLTLLEVKQMARRRNVEGREPAGRTQARKVLELKKAERDLTAITSSILVITTLILGAAAYFTYSLTKDVLTSGNFALIELNATICNWIYSFFVCVAIGYVDYNSLTNGRRAHEHSSDMTTMSIVTELHPQPGTTTRPTDPVPRPELPTRPPMRAQRKSWLNLQRNDSSRRSLGTVERSSTASVVFVTVETEQVCDEADDPTAQWWNGGEGEEPTRVSRLPRERGESQAALEGRFTERSEISPSQLEAGAS